jgi:hypothetical protein
VDVLDGLRAGRIFVAAGGLVTELDFTASAGHESASTSGTIRIPAADAVTVEVRFRDPETPNGSGHDPVVHRLDLIGGDVIPSSGDARVDHNPTTRVIGRFAADAFEKDGDTYDEDNAATGRDQHVSSRAGNEFTRSGTASRSEGRESVD